MIKGRKGLGGGKALLVVRTKRGVWRMERSWAEESGGEGRGACGSRIKCGWRRDEARSVAYVDVMPHGAGLTGDITAPVVLAVTAVAGAVGVSGEAPATAHDATPVHTLGAGVAPSGKKKE